MDQKNPQSATDRSQQQPISQKKAKSMANETSMMSGRGADASDTPELIQEVVQYLEDHWGLRRIEKAAAALGIGSTIDFNRIAEMAPSWDTIKRKVTAKPAQTAALIVAGVGLVLIARQLMSEDVRSPGDEKLHH